MVAGKPDIVLREFQQSLKETGVSVSQTQLWRVLRKLGLRVKKRSLHATERDTEENRRRRKAFLATVRLSGPKN